MPSKKELQPFYKNWFFWILISIGIGYYFTRDTDTPQTPAIDYMAALREKAFTALDSGIVNEKLLNSKTSEDDKEEVFTRIPLDRLKAGSILSFASLKDSNQNISVTILSPTTAQVSVHTINPSSHDTVHPQTLSETGTYNIQIFDGSQILTDSVDHPLMEKPALILENLSYGADHAHPALSKKYCIAKSKHISGTESAVLRIFPWYDPINYPNKGQYFSFTDNQVLYALSIQR